jgi:carbonic anhydrase/acetyltransferase-like protein (isoleucine patch superfamily)
MPIYQLGNQRPRLDRDVWIAPNATVIGDVDLGEASSVWFGAVLRGDVAVIRIGARCNIQDNSVVHVTGGRSVTIVGDDVTVGHMVLLHGCTVGARSLIGMGSIILDEAEIGEECIVGAGSLIPPKAVIPPRSLVLGRPARRVRQVTDEDVAMTLESGRHYMDYAKTFRASLRAVDDP